MQHVPLKNINVHRKIDEKTALIDTLHKKKRYWIKNMSLKSDDNRNG